MENRVDIVGFRYVAAHSLRGTDSFVVASSSIGLEAPKAPARSVELASRALGRMSASETGIPEHAEQAGRACHALVDWTVSCWQAVGGCNSPGCCSLD